MIKKSSSIKIFKKGINKKVAKDLSLNNIIVKSPEKISPNKKSS